MADPESEMNGLHPWLRAAALAGCVAASVSCTPALNWRTVAVPSDDASAMFPCRPDDVARSIRLAGRAASMRLLACRAADATYALAIVDVSDGSTAEAALSEFGARATANVNGLEQPSGSWSPKGAQAGGERVTVNGKWPNGAALVEERATVVVRSKIYRMSVIGDAPLREAVDYFFAGFVVGSH